MKTKKATADTAILKKASPASQEKASKPVAPAAPAPSPKIQAAPAPKAKAKSAKPAGPKPAKASKVKATPARPGLTTIEAKVDIGYGNQLYIRGEGAGLSWDEGKPLKNVDSTTWVWTTDQTAADLRFKLLINDQVWSTGEDITVTPGAKTEVTPAF